MIAVTVTGPDRIHQAVPLDKSLIFMAGQTDLFGNPEFVGKSIRAVSWENQMGVVAIITGRRFVPAPLDRFTMDGIVVLHLHLLMTAPAGVAEISFVYV